MAAALLVALVSGGLAGTLRGGGDYTGAVWTPGQTDTIPTVSVTSPTGGESWQVGTLHNIRWTSAYSTTDSLVYTDGVYTYFIGRQNPPTDTFAWTIPNTPGTNWRVRVFAKGPGGDSSAQSASPFSIVTAPTVTVTSPNGGESWQVGTLHNITWTSTNSTTDSISYSTDNGGSWLFVGTQIPPTNTYAWTVPNTPSPNCLAKVSAIGGSTVEDASDAVFTIALPDTGFVPQPPIPDGPRHKPVKAGGCVAADEETGDLFLLKGNSTCEFYRYDAARGAWNTGDSIPAVDPDGRKYAVKKGASMVVLGGKVYAIKGGRSAELWRYDPGASVAAGWLPVTAVPILQNASQASDGATYIYKLGYCKKNGATPAYTSFTRFTTPNGPLEDLTPPTPHSQKPSETFKTGSVIVYYPDDKRDGTPRVFALQYTTNDFYSYSIGGGQWTWVNNNMPLYWPGVTSKKKVGKGSGMVYTNVNTVKKIYALTGHNTLCLWSYSDVPSTWTAFSLVPPGPKKKKVNDGGGITFASGSLYIVKGNGTSECYSISLLPGKDRALTPGAGLQSAGSNPGPAFGLAVTPNPIVRNSRISFSLPRAGNVRLKLYDASGKLVSTLANGRHPAGPYQVGLSAVGGQLSAGVYLLRLDSDLGSTTRKLVIE
jgi:hypothetical protein